MRLPAKDGQVLILCERKAPAYQFAILPLFPIEAVKNKIMIKVLIADDLEIVRNLLRYVLEKAGDLEVVAMASNGQEAVEEAIAFCPNVAVLDFSMPMMDGLEATRQIRSQSPDTRVLIVSMHRTPHHIKRAIEAGASGYVIKDDLGHDLVQAVHALHQGSRYFSRHVAELVKLSGLEEMRIMTAIDDAAKSLNQHKNDISLLFLAFVIFAECIM